MKLKGCQVHERVELSFRIRRARPECSAEAPINDQQGRGWRRQDNCQSRTPNQEQEDRRSCPMHGVKRIITARTLGLGGKIRQ